jgi:hypothetical protein
MMIGVVCNVLDCSRTLSQTTLNLIRQETVQFLRAPLALRKFAEPNSTENSGDVSLAAGSCFRSNACSALHRHPTRASRFSLARLPITCGTLPEVVLACGPTQVPHREISSISLTGRLPSMVRGCTRFSYRLIW